MLALFEVAVPRGSKLPEVTPQDLAPELVSQAQATADQLFVRYDKNADKRLTRGEMPIEFNKFVFRRYDLNRDKGISYDEAFEVAKSRARSKADRKK